MSIQKALASSDFTPYHLNSPWGESESQLRRGKRSVESQANAKFPQPLPARSSRPSPRRVKLLDSTRVEANAPEWLRKIDSSNRSLTLRVGCIDYPTQRVRLQKQTAPAGGKV